LDIPTYCREIEAHLCRKNDGHLIRVVGPSFERVSSWAARGVPIKIAFEGIDRYFERYYRQGPRRRPVKIDFCEADVLDVFDEWRRATGVIGSVDQAVSADSLDHEALGHESPHDESQIPNPKSRQVSLPQHLERVLMRLTTVRASGVLGDAFDATIDRVAAELDEARAKAGGVRGEARTGLLARLEQLDRDLVEALRLSMTEDARRELAREAGEDLMPFRAGMTGEKYDRALSAAVSALIRSRFGLPTIAFR
jgi:hypothetical protein